MTLILVPHLKALRKKISLTGRRIYHYNDRDKDIPRLEIGCGAQPATVAMQGLYQTTHQLCVNITLRQRVWLP